MTDDEIWTAVVKWLALRTGQKIIRAYESNKRPSLPYVMVNFTGSSPVQNFAQNIEYEDDIVGGENVVRAHPVIDTEWRFSVHAYGQTPTDQLRPIRTAAELAQGNEPLMPSLVIHDVSQVRNVPEYVNETWEPRAQLDLFVRGLTRDGLLVDVIEEHSITIERV